MKRMLNITIEESVSDDKLNISLLVEQRYIYDSDTRKNFVNQKLLSNNGSNIDLQNKTLFRYPDIKLPRNKVDLLKDSHNIKITRNKDIADYHIISDNTIEKHTENKWQRSGNYAGLENVLTCIDQLLDIAGTSKSLHSKIANKNIDEKAPVYITYFKHFGNTPPHIKKTKDAITAFLNSNFNGRETIQFFKDDTFIDELDFSKTVWDSEILDVCNEALAVLTEDDYRSIGQMLRSKNTVDHDLALELMANCNYKKSVDKLALIFVFYQDTICYCNNWNHINAKALRQYLKPFDIYFNRNTGSSYSYLIQSLVKLDSLTNFAVSEITKKMFNACFVENLAAQHEFNVFDWKISDIKLLPKYKDRIKTSLDQKLVDDLPF